MNKSKKLQKRCGSCTPNNELLFNWRCIMASSHILDYIIVHEMCHLYYMNQSQEFWDLLSTELSDYEQRKTE
ncbi:M48 metallopeptidase family protein [Cytobacillus pseudoceanisediminis]